MLPRPSAMLPRPSRIPISKTRYTTQTQHKDKPITQKIKSSPRPSRIPVLNNNRHNPTPQVTKPEAQSTIYSLPRPSEETIPKQPTQIQPTPVTRSPLLPTPPAPARNFNCNNHYNQHIPGPTSRYSTYPTFTRPSLFYNTYPTFSGPANYRYYRSHQQHPHQQHHISRPHTARFNNQRPPLLPRPSDQHQNFMTGPYQQHQHFPQQVFHIHISLPYTG